MSWKKHFKPVNTVLPVRDKINGHTTIDKFSSWLPEIYMGPSDRLQRYIQYEQMDMDHEVSAALDTLSEFSTQKDTYMKTPVVIQFSEEPTPVESQILDRALKQWCRINEFNKRMFGIFRSTLMYGDQFFIRDPESFKLYWVDPHKVEKVMVNESKGKDIETYFIRDLDLNHQILVASNQTSRTAGGFTNSSMAYPQARTNQKSNMTASSSYTAQSGLPTGSESFPVAAEHVVHLSLSDGLSTSWPFGNSILEPVFKTYKQKSMLEDAMLIYRIHRAPERRMFFIDVGNMPPAKAQQYLERVRYEVQQKRIPSMSGGGNNVYESSYNPLSTLEDYFFAQTSDGRGSKVEILPGGENLGEINDMLYFNNKMFRALGIPSSYLPTGPNDGTGSVNDGKVGTAFIQEYRFTEKCKRHQNQIVEVLDREFKLFLKYRGITIDNASFTLGFTPPQNFSDYRQIEIDAARSSVFKSFVELPFISKRFAMRKWGGFTEQEILENERMWSEEQGMNKSGSGNEPGLSQVGISSSDMVSDTDFGGSDFDTGDESSDIGDSSEGEISSDTLDSLAG